jgi:hypothetical protein
MRQTTRRIARRVSSRNASAHVTIQKALGEAVRAETTGRGQITANQQALATVSSRLAETRASGCVRRIARQLREGFARRSAAPRGGTFAGPFRERPRRAQRAAGERVYPEEFR